jgi:hypothetical protein
MNKRKIWTDEQDQLIIEAYSHKKNPLSYLTKLYQFFDYSKHCISWRARKLGVIKKSKLRSNFTPEERLIITKYAGDKTVHNIVRIIKNRTGISRGCTSISNFIRREFKMSVKGDRYSMVQLMIAFRCHRTTIIRWVKEGKLPSHRDLEVPGSPYRFEPIDVKKFIISYPFELEGRAVDVPWLVALLLEPFTMRK